MLDETARPNSEWDLVSSRTPKSSQRRRQDHEMRTILLLATVALTLTNMRMASPLGKFTQYGSHVVKDIDDSLQPNDNLATLSTIKKTVQHGNESSSADFDRRNDCFNHPAMEINFTTNQRNFKEGILRLPTPEVCGSLKRDWRHLPVQSDLAREFEKHQTNCELPVMSYEMDNNFGFGSHLVLWSQALCNAMEKGYRVRASNPDWLWMDKMYCDPETAKLSPLLCYFPNAELRCVDDAQRLDVWNATMPDPRIAETFCKRLDRKTVGDKTLHDFWASSVEFLFQQISPLVIKEAERQIGIAFGERVPDDLITVHLRWGDKFFEMDLAPISEYVAGINTILEKRGAKHNSTANIYLACEDPLAVKAFLDETPKNWKVYVDRTYEELTPYRPPKGNRASWTARNTRGRAGLLALASLLVAMEADAFVFTTASNWSRLMDALRKNAIDPRCGNCTTAVDLRPGIW